MADAAPIEVNLEDDETTVHVDPDTGTITEEKGDGGVVVHLDARKPSKDANDDEWYKNLAEEISPDKLGAIAEELIQAIEADDKSRSEWLETRARGLDILGLKLETPSSDVADASGGISKVTNPLLLEAVLKGWANADAELLPASGPCKISNDSLADLNIDTQLAEAFERGMNHYLTVTAKEYYPNTSHMLLWGTYFGGSGFKKIYRCPMRKRPVSDAVDAKDLIVSDTEKDLSSCARITHQIMMRKSVLKRMQLLGAYRKTTLTQPPTQSPNAVEEKVAGIQGVSAKRDRAEDQPYKIWECQCELDLPDYAPGQFEDEGIPLPYLVTIDKDSREILSITRDWDEEDEDCHRNEMYVRFPYVPGPGFYCTGMLNILGNASAAMTAAWREALDAGMLASFPGGLMAKLGSRQNSATFRLSPGEFQGVETNGMPIQSVVMGMPYKDVTPGLMALIDKVVSQAKGLSTAADIPAGEGIANVPVGTMLAQIEQATKVIAAAHKGMHQAQAEELRLLVDLFRRHPEDFWRDNKEAVKDYWNVELFLQALDNCNLVPKSDPNIPSHMHRVAKAIGLVQLSGMPQFMGRLDPDETLRRALFAIREDPQGLIVQPPPNSGMNPADMSKMVMAQAKMQEVQQKLGKLQLDAQQGDKDNQLKMVELDRQQQLKDADIAKELIIHASDDRKIEMQARKDQADIAGKMMLNRDNISMQRDKHQMEREHHYDKMAMDREKHQHDMHMATREHGLDLVKTGLEAQQADAEHQAGVADSRAKAGLAADGAEWDRQREMMDHALKATKTAHETAAKVHSALQPQRKKRATGGAVTGVGSDETYRPPLDPIAQVVAPMTEALNKISDILVGQQKAFDKMAKAARAPKKVVRDETTGKVDKVVPVPDEEEPDPLNVVVEKKKK